MGAPLFRAVPLDAAFIVDIANYKMLKDGLISNKALSGDFLSISFLKDLQTNLAIIDSFSNNEALNAILNQPHPVMISGHPFRKGDMQCLYYIRVNTSKEFDIIDKSVRASHGIIVGSNRNYENANIQDIVILGTKNEGFSYSWVDGIFIISKSSILLEDAIRQLGAKENILLHNGLNEIVKTAGKTSFLNLFINFEQLPGLLSQIIHPKYRNEINSFENFGSWAEFDMNIKPDMVMLNGFSLTKDKIPGFEAVFKNQKPVKFESFAKIPVTASSFVFMGITNFEQFRKDYQMFAETKENKDVLRSLEENYNIDLAGSFRNLFYHDAGIVYLDAVNDTFENNAFSVIRVKNREEAESMLNNIIGNYVEKQNIKPSDLISVVKSGIGNSQKIYYLPFGNVPYLVFGKLFNISDNHFCTLSDNYLIFGRTKEAVLNYLNNLASGKFISNDMGFNDFTEYYSSQSNFFFYNKPSNSIDFYNNFLKRDLLSDLKSNISKFNSLNSMIYQFNIGDNGLIYNNIFLKFKSNSVQEKSNSSWETKLDDKVTGKPVFLKNGNNNDDEIVVQDSKNQIYFIVSSGKISWKIKLPEPIISDIYQIDYYRNGKKQIIFNTRDQIYLIDRNGKSIDKFPVTLKIPATNGMAVFDYAKKRDYRILLATEGRNLICLDKNARPVNGWNCEPADTIVKQPVQYFKIENKELLVYNDKQRIYIVDRKGKPIFKTINKFNISPLNKVAIVNTRSIKDVKFVITDTAGRIIYTGIDGKIKITDCGVFPSNHWFDMVDVDNDGSKDFIFTWNQTVKAISQKGKEIFTVTTGQAITYRPVFYEFKTHKYNFSIVTATDEKISLYKNNGELFKGFPLKGNTQYSIKFLNSAENKFELIVGSDNFLYGYTVKIQ